MTALAGCGAVYPELATPVRAAPAGAELSPPPPDDMLYLAFQKAEIPERTRDGRRWDAVGGSAPDPFAKLMVGGKELLLTPVQSNTLAPTWPDGPRGNYRLKQGSVLQVELWDSNAISHHPICVKTVRSIHEARSSGGVDVSCDSGARIWIEVAPARAEIGLGFNYELRTRDVYVSRVVRESPAGRIGLREGDQLLKIQGKDTASLREGDAQTLINMHRKTGLELSVKHADARVEDLKLQEGPIYVALNEP